jgi:hypothetical protein
MGGAGNDQGGRWPVGIWFALVGVSAGTVASFALIGWTFARELYGGGDGAEPLHYEPETVVIEADETPAPAGAAGADEEPLGPEEPGAEPQLVASPAEPRAERIAEGDTPPRETLVLVPQETDPPQLVPVEEHDPCEQEEEAALEPGRGVDLELDLEPERGVDLDPEPERGVDLDSEPGRDGPDRDDEVKPEPDREDDFEPSDRGRDWGLDRDRVADTTPDFDLDLMRDEIEAEYDRYLELNG